MEKYTELSVIVEVARNHKGQSHERFAKVLADIRSSKIAGFSVVGVHHQYEEPCCVPGFEHDHKCKDNCICEVQPYSVDRYFNVGVFIAGEPTTDILKSYQSLSFGRVIVCGMCASMLEGEYELCPCDRGEIIL